MAYWELKTAKMYRIVFLVLSSLLIVSCSEKKTNAIVLPYYNEPNFTPIFIKNQLELNEKITHKIADFSFLNQDSAVINQNILKDKIHVANFIFTSCGSICPTMTANMKMVNDSLSADKNLVFLSFSVTPWIDKPHILKQFRERREIKNDNWQFLTGSKAEIYKLARQSYFAEEDIGFSKDSSEFLHTEHFLLVDKNKHIRGIYNGTLMLEMHKLIEDIKTLEKEY